MRGWVYGSILGLTVAMGIVAVYELAGGDATLVVMLILLTTYVGVRLNRVEDLFHELVDQIKVSQATCGETYPLEGGVRECVRRDGHADPWHRDSTGVQWIRTYGGGGGSGGQGLGHT